MLLRCMALTLQMMRSYREAQQVTDALSDLGVLLRFACMWDPKAYKRRQHTVAGLRRDTQLIRCDLVPWWLGYGRHALCQHCASIVQGHPVCVCHVFAGRTQAVPAASLGAD
jgi:hypothetical protein